MILKWSLTPRPDDDDVQSLAGALNIAPELASLLIHREVDSFQKAKTFFRPSLEHLHDPFLMKDMHKAVDRLCEAIHSGEKVLIYGDYDVDGTTSVALVYSFLREFTQTPELLSIYVPDRYKEGYGLSKAGIDHAVATGISLIITLDCGIRAVEKSEYAAQHGIDLIICDHHLPGPTLPNALAILDPKQQDCGYPFKDLSGCGVGFKLMQGFCLQNTIDVRKLFNYLDLVAISIACDIVPMIGENRILAFYGLKKINSSPLPSVKSLIEVSALRSKVNVSDLVFYLGPRINAAGRLTHAKKAVDLLIGEEKTLLDQVASELNRVNIERKQYDLETTEAALEMITETPQHDSSRSTVLFHEDWHKGIVGIVASRCIEHHYRPTIILTESDGKATGSARSVDGFDIHGAIAQCSDLLEQFGGHHHAAGLSMPIENVPAFQKKFEEVVSASIMEEQLEPKLQIDQEVDFSFLTFKSLSIINQMAPFGPGNRNPVFCTRNVKLNGNTQVVGTHHLRLSLTQDGKTIDAIAFKMAELEDRIKESQAFDVAYHIEENEFRGHKSLQIVVKDIKFAT